MFADRFIHVSMEIIEHRSVDLRPVLLPLFELWL